MVVPKSETISNAPETCEAMPYVYGEQESIHVSEVTHVIDGGRGAREMSRAAHVLVR